jgi:hypothetical protein
MDSVTITTLFLYVTLSIFFLGTGILAFMLTLQNRAIPTDVHVVLAGGIVWLVQNTTNIVKQVLYSVTNKKEHTPPGQDQGNTIS